MNKADAFNGLSRKTYDFFWDIAFHNEKYFFDASRERYKTDVQMPLYLLAAELEETAKSVDSDFATFPSKVVSRIRRDTRFSKDKCPFRDHAWLGYKHYGERIGQSFCMYAEFERNGYGYGMGMYAPDPQMMKEFRSRIMTKPGTFLSLVNNNEFTTRFSVVGESYKRDRFPDAAPELKPWLNRKQISFCYFSESIERTYSKEIEDEIKGAFLLMRPVYRFLTGLD